MNAWDQDRRRSGGAGWVLDESGEWVPSSGQAEAPQAPAPKAPRMLLVASTDTPPSPRRGHGPIKALMTAVVIPALAAGAVLYVWKGPGGEIALSRIEPLVADLLAPAPETPLPRPDQSIDVTIEAPTYLREPGSHALPAAGGCASVRRGMGNGIVFHRTGGCPDGS